MLLEAILCYPEKGKPGVSLNQAILQAGVGLEGNRKSGGCRQLCVLDSAARRWLDVQTQRGICFDRFKENLRVEGEPDCMEPGDRYRLGTAVIVVPDERKGCHGECPLAAASAPCPLAGRALYANVEQSGQITVGDRLVPVLR